MRAETAPILHIFYNPKRVSKRFFLCRKSAEIAKKNAAVVARNIDIRAELPI